MTIPAAHTQLLSFVVQKINILMFPDLLLAVNTQSSVQALRLDAQPTPAEECPEGLVLLGFIMRGNVFSGFVRREVNLAYLNS